jgi:acyl-CoA synthetase (NDP forming)
MQELIPTNALGNPFDTTGLLYNERDYGKVFDHYLLSDVYDTVLVVSSTMDLEHEQFNSPLTDALLRAAQQGGKRLVAASTTATQLGGWVQSYIDAGVGVGGGIVPTVRSLKAMDRFVRLRHRMAPDPVTPVSPHEGLRMESRQGHDVVCFGDAAKLWQSFDLPVAPFVLADPTSSDLQTALDSLPPCDRYVVKLANVLHRSDLGAVITEVTKPELRDAATRLSGIADSHGLPREIVVQPQLASRGEVFLGAQSTSALGPIVLFGLGGVFVEVLSDVSARLAPFTAEDARDMVGEIRGHKVMAGVRGGSPWDIDELVAILVRFGDLAAATVGWLDSIDVNPLIVTEGGFSAVDICCIARPGYRSDSAGLGDGPGSRESYSDR